MSRTSRSMHARKLAHVLGMIDDEAFVHLVWATNRLQSGRDGPALGAIRFPAQARTTDWTSKWYCPPWKLETLVNELLATPKRGMGNKRTRYLDPRSFEVLARAMNELTAIENADDGLTLRRIDVRVELHRMAQRQFEWQRTFSNRPRYYRYGFLYGGTDTKRAFAATHGIPLDDFTLACFCLTAMWRTAPVVPRGTSLALVGLPEETTARVLSILSATQAEARREAAALRAEAAHVSYKRSLLRPRPCIAFGDRLHAPLPDLIAARATEGLYYDVIGASGGVRNEISERFESYGVALLRAMLAGCVVSPASTYRRGKNTVDTPDIRVAAGRVAVVMECKATRMSHDARFSDDPMGDAPRGYDELAKGAFQIWRYASHHRRGIVDADLAQDVVGVVLTLDTWAYMSTPMIEDVLEGARRLAAEKEPEMTEVDRIPLAFCSIEDLEATLRVCDRDGFLASVRALASERYRGWHLRNVHDEEHVGERTDNDYPFADRLGEVLPWWDRTEPARLGA